MELPLGRAAGLTLFGLANTICGSGDDPTRPMSVPAPAWARLEDVQKAVTGAISYGATEPLTLATRHMTH